jgi:hypothetical protein
MVEVRPDGTVHIDVDGQKLILWNHDPERIAEAFTNYGGVLEYQRHWGILWVPNQTGRYAFCVASAGHVNCSESQPLGNLAGLLQSVGGFTHSVNET